MPKFTWDYQDKITILKLLNQCNQKPDPFGDRAFFLPGEKRSRQTIHRALTRLPNHVTIRRQDYRKKL